MWFVSFPVLVLLDQLWQQTKVKIGQVLQLDGAAGQQYQVFTFWSNVFSSV